MIEIQHNIATGEIKEIELSPDEKARRESDQIRAYALLQKAEEKRQQRMILLSKLGITEEEAKLLLG